MKGGWKNFMRSTDRNKKLDEMAVIETDDPEIILNGIENELKKQKYISFGKVKKSTKDKHQRELDNLQKQKVLLKNNPFNTSIEEELLNIKMAGTLKTIQRNKFEKDVKYLENIKASKGKSAANFKLRDLVLGKKNKPIDPIVLIDPFSTCAQLGHSLLEELERDDTSNTVSLGKLIAGVVRCNE